jgi:hypothetical protein
MNKMIHLTPIKVFTNDLLESDKVILDYLYQQEKSDMPFPPKNEAPYKPEPSYPQTAPRSVLQPLHDVPAPDTQVDAIMRAIKAGRELAMMVEDIASQLVGDVPREVRDEPKSSDNGVFNTLAAEANISRDYINDAFNAIVRIRNAI